jgi:3-deoxy-D-arabino-heptulosonate 7-phosphate (DAHP) synthase class II
MCPIASLVLQASVLGATTPSYLFYWSHSILHFDYEQCITRQDIEATTAFSGYQTVTVLAASMKDCLAFQ